MKSLNFAHMFCFIELNMTICVEYERNENYIQIQPLGMELAAHKNKSFNLQLQLSQTGHKEI